MVVYEPSPGQIGLARGDRFVLVSCDGQAEARPFRRIQSRYLQLAGLVRLRSAHIIPTSVVKGSPPV